MNYYLRFYANSEKVRSWGGNRTELLKSVIDVYPHVWKCVEFVSPPREPIMIMGFYVSKRSKKHRLYWIIRGYEQNEIYRPATIFKPNKPLVFKPDEDRSQAACFMKLLQVGYSIISFEEFLQYRDVADLIKHHEEVS